MPGKTIMAFAAAATALGLASAAHAAAVALPTEVYTFTGACTDCTGVGIGTLTLRGYTQGTALTQSEFVSFTYSSNLLPAYTVAAPDFVSGDLSVIPGQDDVSLYNSSTGADFFSSTSGSWCTGNGCLADEGATHVWSQAGASAAPEPASWALLLAGVGLTGAALRMARRKTSAAMA